MEYYSKYLQCTTTSNKSREKNVTTIFCFETNIWNLWHELFIVHILKPAMRKKNTVTIDKTSMNFDSVNIRIDYK